MPSSRNPHASGVHRDVAAIRSRAVATRDREAALARAVGLQDAVERAQERVGAPPGPGSELIPGAEIGDLSRLGHQLRVDIQVLADVMGHLGGAPAPERADMLSRVAATTAPHLRGGPNGYHRTVATSPVAHVDAAGARFGYRVAGQGTPLLLIQDLGSPMATWDPAFVEPLALGGRRVTMFDNRGIGTSTWSPDDEITIPTMAADALAVLDALGIGRADVLGWGMGGRIAQELALREPERVGCLILAATDAGGPSRIRGAIAEPDSRPEAAEGWKARVAAQHGVEPEWFHVPDDVHSRQRHACESLWTGPDDGTRGRLGQITAPTLVIGGTADEEVPADNARLLAEELPTAILRLYDGLGHRFLFQEPATVAGDVTAFLRARLQP